LENIKFFFFNTGYIYHKKESLVYKVESKKGLSIIINHFEKYPLITQKQADYILFRQALELVFREEHLTLKGLNKIIAIKSSLNLGLPPLLKKSFPDAIPVQRPIVDNSIIPHPYWFVGFTEGEGSFMVNFLKSSTHLSGYQVQLRFQITQHLRDKKLMENLIKYLDCGKFYLHSNTEAIDIIVQKFSDIVDKIVPIFNKYPLVGEKSKNFKDFFKVVKLIETKAHLTHEGLEQIKKIKSGMNTRRV